jgi:hypothetical protein
MTVFGAIACFPGRLSQPVEGDPALRWTGPASETTMTTENPISPCRRAPWNMFNLAIDSKLRGCDLVRLTIDDMVGGGIVRDRATVIQKKTGPTGAVRDHRADPERHRRVARQARRREGPVFVPEPVPGTAAYLHAAVCPYRPAMGGARRSR